MKTDTPSFSRPERFLILIAGGGDDCRGRAVRISDSSEIRFANLAELTAWLKSAATHPLTTTHVEGADDA